MIPATTRPTTAKVPPTAPELLKKPLSLPELLPGAATELTVGRGDGVCGRVDV